MNAYADTEPAPPMDHDPHSDTQLPNCECNDHGCEACGAEANGDWCPKCDILMFPKDGELECARCWHAHTYHFGEYCSAFDDGERCDEETGVARADYEFDRYDEIDRHFDSLDYAEAGE